MKTMKRLAVLTGTVAVAGTLLSPSAFAAPQTSPTGVAPYNSTQTPGGGGDYGIGNCGYNNGGGTKFEGPEGGKNPGLGGFRKGECPPKVTSGGAASAPVTESTTGSTTESTTGSTTGSTTDSGSVELVVGEVYFS